MSGWVKKNAIAKLDGRVGLVLANPDSDGDVKLRWADAGTTSRYIRASRLRKATDADQRQAVQWCQKHTLAVLNGKTGEVTMDPDSDAEVKLKWPDGKVSGYVRAVRLQRPSTRYTYTAKGGSSVCVPVEIDPWKVLGVPKDSGTSAVKQAFRRKIETPQRQQRALVSYAKHMIDANDHGPASSNRLNAYDYAISGHTEALQTALATAGGDAVLNKEDTSGRTLLYLAARSGFYDTCEVLLKRGASLCGCGRDKSSPLHAASYYGHHMVCMLLIHHGADTTYRNSFGNTAEDEAKDSTTRQQIQQTRGDTIAALALDTTAIARGLETVVHDGKLVAKRLRHRSNTAPAGWKPAWHGTKLKWLRSILQHGLKPSGSSVGGMKITPPNNHYELGSTHFGIENCETHATTVARSKM